MKIALVTGATSGIGYALSKQLLEMNYVVYGVGRNFAKLIDFSSNFKIVKCDLAKLNELEAMLKELKKVPFDLIINAAGVGYFGLCEEINSSKIQNMIAVNLQAPLIISQFFLRGLKERKGMIINISSITAKKESPLAAVYSATKIGLSHFGKNLFEEVRKTGVKVVNIYPDMTKTNFYENNNFFDCDDDRDAYLETDDLREILNFILNQNNSVVLTDITIRPQKHKIKKKGNTK